jgi:glycosyltransferase involved in cell wall biosynthesis
MARGLPVISSPTVGSAHDLIRDGVNGFLRNPRSAREYADAMRFFMDNPGQVLTFGVQARNTARQYTPEWGVQQLMKILTDSTGGAGVLAAAAD